MDFSHTSYLQQQPPYILVVNFYTASSRSIKFGPVASNHENLYNEILALVLGRYGVFHAEANGTD